MIELLLPCGFDTLEYYCVKGTIGICMLIDYFMAKKCQQLSCSMLDFLNEASSLDNSLSMA
jgi:hypothetical protein